MINHEIYKDYQTELEAGWEFSQILFEDSDVMFFDARKKVPSVEIPVYFFVGRTDYDTPSELVEDYYARLISPKKQLIWFENSSHFPFYSEPEKFNSVLIEKLIID